MKDDIATLDEVIFIINETIEQYVGRLVNYYLLAMCAHTNKKMLIEMCLSV